MGCRESNEGPSYLVKLGLAFEESRIFLSAVELDLFTILHGKKMTADNIRVELGLHKRAYLDFLDALVTLDVVNRDGDGESALYSNTNDTETYLSKRSPKYMAGFLKMASTRLYKFWGGLTDALKTGKLQNEAKVENVDIFDKLYDSEQRACEFANAMGALKSSFAVLSKSFDFSQYKTLLDVGGATAQLSCEVAKVHPNILCKSMDLKQVEKFANQNIKDHKLDDRIQFLSGDFFKDDLISSDVVCMGRVLHDFDLKTKKMLIRKAYNALPKNGAYIVVETLIDNERRKHKTALVNSLNMLIETSGGSNFSENDFKEWGSEIGFRNISVIELEFPVFALIAIK